MNFLKRLKAYFSSKRKLMEKFELLNSKRTDTPCVSVINQQEKEDDNWHLIVDNDGQEIWIRPKHITYVGPIEKNQFEIIIDGNKMSFSKETAEESKQLKNLILNIESVSKTNTYDTSKETSDLIDQQLRMQPTKIMTQYDVDSLNIKNKAPTKKSFFQKIFKK